ncbi:uncharacterized protein LOC128958453 [Oppia nitens]|uniref:uncharacterized protein LOC128958453 n=1 Tax=Oppia nitens TaxID=1686743 RepID=UPI0023D98ECC|nr:uncharacterized protein LOC128958453 [Oppia nitens]
MNNKKVKDDRLLSSTKKASLMQTMKVFETILEDLKSTVLVPTLLNDIDSQTMAKNGLTVICSHNQNLFDVYNDLQKLSKILFGDRNQSEIKCINGRNDMNGNNNIEHKNEDNEYLAKKDNLLTKFEFHVKQLRHILTDLCETADYISNVYKEDVHNMHMNYNNIEYNNSEIKHYYTSNSSIDQNL